MSKTEAKVYNTIASQYYKYKKDQYPKECLEEFFMYMNPNSSILDLGCGPGQMCKILSEGKHSVIGLDFSQEMLKIAKKEAPYARFILGDIRNLENIFSPKSFDGVWACSSLIHIAKEEIPSVFNQVHNVLRDKGLFYLSVKEGEGEKDRIDNRYNNISRHFSYFKFMELSDLLIKSRLKPIYSSTNIAKYETPTGNTWINFIVKKE